MVGRGEFSLRGKQKAITVIAKRLHLELVKGGAERSVGHAAGL